jgi:hypothetical protein
MSKTEIRSNAQSRLFPTRTQSLRFPPLNQHNNSNNHNNNSNNNNNNNNISNQTTTTSSTANMPPSRLTLTSIPESRLTLSRLTLSRLTSVSKRSTGLRRSETVIHHKNPEDRLVFQSLSKKDHEKLKPIANAYSLPVPKIKLLILNSRPNENQTRISNQSAIEYNNEFENISHENTFVNELKVVGSRIEPLKSAKSRPSLFRSESMMKGQTSQNSIQDYNNVEYANRPKTSNLQRNPLVIDE